MRILRDVLQRSEFSRFSSPLGISTMSTSSRAFRRRLSLRRRDLVGPTAKKLDFSDSSDVSVGPTPKRKRSFSVLFEQFWSDSTARACICIFRTAVTVPLVLEGSYFFSQLLVSTSNLWFNAEYKNLLIQSYMLYTYECDCKVLVHKS